MINFSNFKDRVLFIKILLLIAIINEVVKD
jgi:hypothetical protein